MGNAFQSPAWPKPRSLLDMFRSGTVVCLGLWAGVAVAVAAAPPTDPSAAAATAYRQATESVNKEDYSHALDLLDHAPAAGKPSEQADVWNLRGAIHLHQQRYDQARAAFVKAIAKDPGLWAARFNLAEINFRQGRYSESSRQFEELMGRTSRWSHADEHGFLQYKLLLTQLLAGREKPAQTYLNEHRGDRSPSLMYFYLNAAMEHRRGHGKQAEAWLAQADAQYSPANEQVFAESFRALGWYTQRSERLIAAARRHDAAATTPANMAMVELMPGQAAAKTAGAPAPAPPAAPTPKPAFRNSPPPAPVNPPVAVAIPPVAPVNPPGAAATPPVAEAVQMPPAASNGLDLNATRPADVEGDRQPESTDLAQDADAASDPRAVFSTPILLARPNTGSGNKPKATPAASPAAAAPVAPATTPASTPSPSPTVAASAPANPVFTEKYEKAYVQFLQKNYGDARKLLDEADAIQPSQTTSVNLRGQIFKHFYETAYAAYKQRADYPGTLVQLDEADITQPNQPDALNLRGLTYSKLKDYEHAEAAFKRAIGADPQFWAARFNYAELPFNYRNYTAARSRFEELSAQTDSSKQPREVELTQFKIFLTLLLEGKVDGARSFMGHLSFTEKTPARYFCLAALDFYGGSADKAQTEIDNASKAFVSQPKLVDIFKESFYRIGWLNDPGNPASGPPPTAASPGTSVAEATPGGSPAGSPGESPAVALVTPAASPALTPAVAAGPSAAPAAAATPVASVAAETTPVAEATPAPVHRAKLSRKDNLIRLLVIGFVLLNTAWNSIRLFAAMNQKARRVAPIRRSPLYADQPEVEQPDEVETPR